MANLITATRLLLLFVVVLLAYHGSPLWRLANAALLIFVFVLDGVDGYVARKRGESSLFGSVFDIAADRVVENVLWVVLADLDLVPVWVAILFITRSFLVDSVRSDATAQGETPFGMMRSPLGRFLVAGRFMRMLYGVAKAATFAWILFWQPMPELAPALWSQWAGGVGIVTQLLIGLSVVLCLVRGIPVLIEFAHVQGVWSRSTREPR